MNKRLIVNKMSQKLNITSLIIFLFIAIFSLGGCNRGKNGLSTDIIQNGKTPKISFSENMHDFGDINEGDVVTYTFDFTNTGDGDLLITDAHAQCSCTVPEWPKDIIKPGGKGIIRVKFDTNGKSGIVTKVITVEANTNPKITKIQIKANIHEQQQKQQ